MEEVFESVVNESIGSHFSQGNFDKCVEMLYDRLMATDTVKNKAASDSKKSKEFDVVIGDDDDEIDDRDYHVISKDEVEDDDSNNDRDVDGSRKEMTLDESLSLLIECCFEIDLIKNNQTQSGRIKFNDIEDLVHRCSPISFDNGILWAGLLIESNKLDQAQLLLDRMKKSAMDKIKESGDMVAEKQLQRILFVYASRLLAAKKISLSDIDKYLSSDPQKDVLSDVEKDEIRNIYKSVDDAAKEDEQEAAAAVQAAALSASRVAANAAASASASTSSATNQTKVKNDKVDQPQPSPAEEQRQAKEKNSSPEIISPESTRIDQPQQPQQQVESANQTRGEAITSNSSSSNNTQQQLYQRRPPSQIFLDNAGTIAVASAIIALILIRRFS